jgi:hypothetical protein
MARHGPDGRSKRSCREQRRPSRSMGWAPGPVFRFMEQGPCGVTAGRRRTEHRSRRRGKCRLAGLSSGRLVSRDVCGPLAPAPSRRVGGVLLSRGGLIFRVREIRTPGRCAARPGRPTRVSLLGLSSTSGLGAMLASSLHRGASRCASRAGPSAGSRPTTNRWGAPGADGNGVALPGAPGFNPRSRGLPPINESSVAAALSSVALFSARGEISSAASTLIASNPADSDEPSVSGAYSKA